MNTTGLRNGLFFFSGFSYPWHVREAGLEYFPFNYDQPMNPVSFLYLRLFAALSGVVLAGAASEEIFSLFEHAHEAELAMAFFSAALIFALAFGIFYLSKGTHLPSFVVAIFFGMAAKPLLMPVIEQDILLGGIVGFGATLILFGGGLETPFANFRKLIWKILALSFPGLMITAVLFSLFLSQASGWLSTSISVTTAILLGAILASTDPAAIIPALKRLRFNKPSTRDIVVSESAVTDVTGTILTVAFLSILGTAGTLGASVLGGYGLIFSADTVLFLLRQIAFGVLFGVLGYSLLAVLLRFKAAHDREYEVDAAFFLFIPVIIFTLAIAFGGSGYLAAFVAGLLFVMSDTLHETERFFNHIIDGFFKPTIFLLLGALVDLQEMFDLALIGLLCAIVFMFFIRPLVVFLCLGPSMWFDREGIGYRELLFISFVRETGAIPAVLLVTVASSGFTGLEGLIPIGMWVILATLVIEPPLTPWIAKKLGVATVIEEDQPQVNGDGEAFVVLGTRGETYKRRLPLVVQWAKDRDINKIVVLLCLEYKHQPELEQRITQEAQGIFTQLNESLLASGHKAIKFSLTSSVGFLQENIDYIAKHEPHLVAIFVGRKMLDFRLDEVKKLSVPIQFME